MSSDTATRRLDRAALAIAALACVYWGWLAWTLSYEIDGERWFVLFDDAMVSMRYARNAARGLGLVYNPGERVEGFTNPLWVGLMVLVHLVVTDLRFTSLAVQVVSLLALLGTLWQVRRLALLISGGDRSVAVAAMLLTGSFYSLSYWALHGMEVGAVSFLVTWSVAEAAEAVLQRRFSLRPFVLLAVASWVRLDAVVAFPPLLGVMLWRLDRPLRPGLSAATLVLASVGLQTLARLLYYGEWVPNTYVLKMEGIAPWTRAGYGLFGLVEYASSVWFVPFLLPLLALVLRPGRPVLLALGPVAASWCYTVWVGGDAFESPSIGANRFVSVAMPLALALCALACRDLAEWLASVEGMPRGVRRLRPALAWTLVAGTFVAANALDTSGRWRTLAGQASNQLAEGGRSMVERALALDRVTRPDAKIAVAWAGILPYFLDRPIIDELGKVDQHIARLPMHAASWPWTYRAGHMKWDEDYSIGALAPDVVVYFWDKSRANSPLRDLYAFDPSLGVHVRKGSPRVQSRWAAQELSDP